MILNYKANCVNCGFKTKLQYGRAGKSDIVEIFSCKKCGNLFSLHVDKKKCCPKCKGEDLISYIPDKKQNLAYYRKMLDTKMLTKAKYNELEEFWKDIEDTKCPKCKKMKLEWIK